jgi:malate dehydrogenase
MIKAVLFDEKRMLPCAAFLNGEYGMKDVYMGVPVILGEEGVEKIVEVKLANEEKAQLRKSYASVKKLIQKLSL